MNTIDNKKYNLVAENPQSTVVAEYAPVYRTAKSYQSEAELERAFIEQLQSQAPIWPKFCRLYHAFLPEGSAPKNARVFWIN